MCNGVTETYVRISHTSEHSHCFGFPFCENGCGLRTTALQQILVTMRRNRYHQVFGKWTVCSQRGRQWWTVTLMYWKSSSSKGIACSSVYGRMLLSTVAAISSGAGTLSSMKKATLRTLPFQMHKKKHFEDRNNNTKPTLHSSSTHYFNTILQDYINTCVLLKISVACLKLKCS